MLMKMLFFMDLKIADIEFLLVMQERTVQLFRPSFAQLYANFSRFRLDLFGRNLQQVISDLDLVAIDCDGLDTHHRLQCSNQTIGPVSYTHLRAHETDSYLV